MFFTTIMTNAQQKINKKIISDNFIPTQIKNQLALLTKDITAFYTSTCHVCDDQYNTNPEAWSACDNEHIKIEQSWGYNSTHDTETHTLTLCNKCYDKHILKGFLGKHIKINNYM